MKKILVLLGVALIGLLAWMAAGPDRAADSVPMAVPRAMGVAPVPANGSARPFGAKRDNRSASEPPLPAGAIAPVPAMGDADAPRPMIVPVAGVDRSAMRDSFNEVRGDRRHEAIDILAPRGTPVVATDDGSVKKLFTSAAGGLTIYEFDPDQRFCYYYAHLDGYAAGLHEGQAVHRGEILGYVGTTGNAPKDTPHLHFALIRLAAGKRWWQGTYVNPYPLLAGRPGG